MTQLSQQRIIDAALDILQRYGLQDLSIRKVATVLKVQPGALYWHFPHKQALLGAVANYILSTPADDPTTDFWPVDSQPTWVNDCSALLTDLHARLLDFRDGAELVSAAFAAQTCTIPHLATIEELLEQNLPTGTVNRTIAARALIVFTLGATLDEQTRTQLSELAEPSTDNSEDESSPVFMTGAQLLVAGLLNLAD